MGIELEVGTGVLIPRDDTEVLVRSVLDIVENKLMPYGQNKLKILDLASGSGAIAIALSKYLKISTDIYALDISQSAFCYLKKNIQNNKVNINCIIGDILADFYKFKDEEFDIIVSNPPYIPSEDIKLLDKEVQSEPILALDGGSDGLRFYRAICTHWASKIKKAGILAVEIGIHQEKTVKSMFKNAGLRSVTSYMDINSIPRVIVGKK